VFGFDWDRGNLRKILAHRIRVEEAEQVLLNDPIPILRAGRRRGGAFRLLR
jgi:hypothetical protein